MKIEWSRTPLRRLLDEPVPEPRRALRDWYVILTAICLFNAVFSYGHWVWLLSWFVLAVWYGAAARAEHRALRIARTVREQTIKVTYVCRDCLEIVAWLTQPASMPPPPECEIHNGSPIPFAPDQRHSCWTGISLTDQGKKAIDQ